jgi:hypothetical protein
MWLFVNLPYPLLTDTVTTVLGNLLTTKIFHACMQRPPRQRPYRLILDEARFFNTGPLDMVLETSRAYRLWLTLVVQSLEQMARLREGHLDWHLRDTAINNVRYWAAFHNTADKALLADLMFPVTGQKVIGVRQSGDSEYQPVMAEENENQRRFAELKHRQMILWDKWGRPPEVWQTPPVIMDDPPQEQLDEFEADHLRRTGVPMALILEEIKARQAQIAALMHRTGSAQAAQPVAPAQFGGQLG